MAEDDEDLTHGEIGRTLKRLERGQRDADDRLTHVAGEMVPSSLFATAIKGVTDSVASLRSDMTSGFDRIEKTSLERRDALAGQIRDLKKTVDGHESGRTAKAANWIAFSLLLLTAIGLLVTIVGHGGR
jgi:hypothetical protein